MLRVKRVYDPPSEEDGYRILVDRVWPRGVTKEAAAVREWRRDLAPSDDLRKWFGHDPAKWDEFRRRYRDEIEKAGKLEELHALAERPQNRTVTLVFGAKDPDHNQAVALREMALGR